MAGKKGNVFNKILNFIGLVDDGEPADSYDDGYDSDEPERPRTTIPRREPRNTQGRSTQDTRRRSSDYGPARDSRDTVNSYGSSRTEGSQNFRRNAAASSNARGTGRYDYASRTSRFDDTPREEPRQEPREKRKSVRSRTVMYAIHSVEDCCDAIDSLILNNTVLLNMEELDNATMQRSVDTMCGAVFALHATIKKASERTYLIAPMSVEVDEVYERRI